ncbi:conserved hypothetical protein [metagenome]|uniref:Uncharacterized protein n=1 Tax=metagenome TaxID=256318 RepID=A0A2P2BW49_9ZZZZ
MSLGDEQPGASDREPVGSVTEEAVKLLGALFGELGAAAHEVNDHVATGSEDCRFCPICRGVHLIRDTSPEVRAHLGAAAASLLSAWSALTATPDPAGSGTSVEHIDLDDEVDDNPWFDESGDES